MEQLFPSLAKIIAGLDNNERGRQAIIFAAWRRAAGISIASKTEPHDVDDARLRIRVTDDAWLTHLQALAPQLLGKVNRLIGDGTIKRIEFFV